MKRRANYNVQTLEDQILVEATKAVQGINQLKSGITGLKSQLDSLSKNNGLSNFNKQAKQSTSILSALQKTFNFSAIYLGARQVLSTLTDMTNASVDYAETANLFNVSFGKGLEGLNQYYEQALDFQERLEEKLGINIEESMRYQALFNSMTKSMGLGANYAYTLSENMTKLGYDLASLYNIDPESAMTKLRAGLAGQTEPLRELGLDITEQSLKPVAQSLGVNESIRNMSQAEKAVLRYIAVLRQAQIAQGDFARTMDSPANQLRIFNAQVTAFKRNMGNLWQGILGGILPYVNAVMMVINELLKMVAKLFGFEVSSQPIDIGTSIGAGDLASDLGDANKKAKELKAQLMGFDEINNINLDNDTSSGGGSSGGGAGGIDQRLLDALKGYDNWMDKISNKATEIRDKILDWLGVTDGTYKNLKRIGEVVAAVGIALGTWKISSAVTNLLKNLGVLKGHQAFQLAFGITLLATGIFAQYKGTKHLLDGDIDLFTLLETFLGTTSGAFGIVSILKATKLGKSLSLGNKLKVGFGVMLGIQGVQVFLDGISEGDIKKTLLGAFEGVTSLSVAFNGLFGKKLLTSIKNTIGSISSFGIATVNSFKNARASGLSLGQSFITAGKDAMNLVPTSVKVGAGILGITTSCVSAYNSMKQFSEGSISTGEAIAQAGTSIAGAAASGAMLGSVIPGIGTALGALIGTIGGTISSIIGLSNATNNYTYDTSELKEEINSLSESYKNNKKSIEDNVTANLAELDYVEQLKNSLSEMIDTNGKVKQGYEERAKVILGELSEALGEEYTMTDNNIHINGELVDSYGELDDAINTTIENKRKEIELDATKDLLTEAIKQEAKAKNEVAKAQENLNEKIAKYNENPWNIIDANAVNEANDALEEAQKNLSDATDDVTQYSKEFTDKTVQLTGEFSAQMIEQGDITKETLQSLAKDNTAVFLEELSKLDSSTQGVYLQLATTMDTLSPEIIEKWRQLGAESEGSCLGSLSVLPGDVQATILSSITTVDNMNDGMKMAWSTLAITSKDDFNKALSSLPADVQGTILASVIAVQGMTETTKEAYNNLSTEGKAAFNNTMASMDTDTKNKIQSAVNEINRKQWEAGQAGSNVGTNAKSNFDSGLGDTNQSGKNFVQGFLDIVSQHSPLGILRTVADLGIRIVSSFNGGLQEQSPSKATKLSAKYFVQGFTDKMKQLTPNLLEQVENLGVGITDKFDENLKVTDILNGFTVKPNDYKIKTSQIIDYGTISGNINTQTKVATDNLPEQVRQAVIEGMSQASIPIEIEAKTDEGIIFTRMQAKAKEFVMQTGEEPFPSPAI